MTRFIVLFVTLLCLGCNNSPNQSPKPVESSITSLETISIDCKTFLDQGVFSTCISKKNKLTYNRAGAIECMYMIKGSSEDHRAVLILTIHDYQNSLTAAEKMNDLKSNAKGQLVPVAGLGTTAMMDVITADYFSSKSLYIQESNLLFTLKVRAYKEEPTPCIYEDAELTKMAHQFIASL